MAQCKWEVGVTRKVRDKLLLIPMNRRGYLRNDVLSHCFFLPYSLLGTAVAQFLSRVLKSRIYSYASSHLQNKVVDPLTRPNLFFDPPWDRSRSSDPCRSDNGHSL